MNLSNAINPGMSAAPAVERPTIFRVVNGNAEVLLDIKGMATRLSYLLSTECPEYPDEDPGHIMDVGSKLSLQSQQLEQVAAILEYILRKVGEG